jgi:1-phosphofructokinase
MKFNTITLNPALDRTVFLSEFNTGALNRTKSTVMAAGGKGINVSRMLSSLGAEGSAFAFCGGDNGRILRSLCERDGIDCAFVESECETRTCIKIIEDSSRCTEINERGGPIKKSESDSFFASVEKSAKAGDMWIIAGSFPPGVDNNVYNLLTSMLKSHGCKVVLDCDGEALKNGLRANPMLIKPNMAELSSLVGYTVDTVEKAVSAAQCVYVQNHVDILCTMSEMGAVYVGEAGVYRVDAPKVDVKGFAGAGDCFLAAYLYKYSQGCDIPECLSFASAAAAAKVELSGTAVPDTAAIEKYTDRVVQKMYI